MQRCIALFHIGLFNIVISEDLKKFMEILKSQGVNAKKCKKFYFDVL